MISKIPPTGGNGMKKVVVVVASLIAALPLLTAQGLAQDRGKATLGGEKVVVEYGRPSVRGRDVMGMIGPGSYWRMGMNEATTLTTQVDLKFGDKVVSKGSYTLVAHFVEEDKWNLVVAKQVGAGYKPQGVVAEVPGELVKDAEHVEQLTIELEEKGDGATLVLSWSTYRLSASIKIGS
jgi:hypothetical protein